MRKFDEALNESFPKSQKIHFVGIERIGMTVVLLGKQLQSCMRQEENEQFETQCWEFAYNLMIGGESLYCAFTIRFTG